MDLKEPGILFLTWSEYFYKDYQVSGTIWNAEKFLEGISIAHDDALMALLHLLKTQLYSLYRKGFPEVKM